MGVALIWRDALFLSGFVDDAPSVRYDAGLFLDAAAALAAARRERPRRHAEEI
jgi:hypothetical protein